MNKQSKVNNSCGLSFDHLQEKTVVEKSPSLGISYNFSPEAEVKKSEVKHACGLNFDHSPEESKGSLLVVEKEENAKKTCGFHVESVSDKSEVQNKDQSNEHQNKKHKKNKKNNKTPSVCNFK